MFKNMNKNVSLEIILDDNFNGIMYGSPEESLGCNLKGKIVLNNRNSLSARYLLFVFLGKITVACGPPMSSSRPEYSETQLIFRKECLFHNSTASCKKIPAGIHEYYFDFDLPGNLPSSFKGPRGKIEYYCNAILARPRFYSDVAVKKSIHLKRCLMDETRAQTHDTTFSEGVLDEKVRYQISTPIMTVREGGLVNAELTLKPINSGIVIEAVEYGLKEQIHYHTTGEQLMAVIADVNEDRYPLGPKKQINFNPNFHDSNPIIINFRLCPWVNCDVSSQLINVNHKLSFIVCISETINIVNQSDLSFIESSSSISSSSEGTIPLTRNSSHRISAPTPLRSTTIGSRGERGNRAVSLLPSARSSRTFSLSSIVNSRRCSTVITKVEKKYLHFEIPIIVTTKCYRMAQQSPPYTFVDRPPAYSIVSMIPPPPEYVDNENTSPRESIDNVEYAYEDL